MCAHARSDYELINKCVLHIHPNPALVPRIECASTRYSPRGLSLRGVSHCVCGCMCGCMFGSRGYGMAPAYIPAFYPRNLVLKTG